MYTCIRIEFSHAYTLNVHMYTQRHTCIHKWEECDMEPSVVQVALCCSVPAHWLLLKARLEKICPRSQGAQALWRWNSRGQEPLQQPFLLQVTSYNREGVLHGE